MTARTRSRSAQSAGTPCGRSTRRPAPSRCSTSTWPRSPRTAWRPARPSASRSTSLRCATDSRDRSRPGVTTCGRGRSTDPSRTRCRAGRRCRWTSRRSASRGCARPPRRLPGSGSRSRASRPAWAWHMVQEVIRFAEWAGADRLRAPGDVTRALLVEWLIENKRGHPPRSVSQRLSWLRLFLNHARVLGLAIGTDATYLPGELAIRAESEKPPRYFDDAELGQLDAPANQAKLNDYNRRAYQVLRHTA